MSNRVTVGLVLREQFSTTENAIETLLRRTKESFDLVIVDSGSPPEVRDYLEAFAQEHQATLL
ncbi:MAG: glycosyltransferase, partial [Rubripirellula sp.]|nr:glycosyltransferase [Rubripirellula sp.]